MQVLTVACNIFALTSIAALSIAASLASSLASSSCHVKCENSVSRD